MVSRNADLNREWEPITTAHEDVLADYRDSFSELLEGASPDPLAIVGAYGSGKTQLMYQIFREAWERDIGAVYIGDPQKLLSEFEDSAESQIEVWLEDRIEDEIDHYVNGDPEDVTWFPNTEPEQKQEWIQTNVTVETPDDISKYAILVDEVEQHYEDFLAAVETDDDNPLRVINDEVPNTLKVWSFGMLSAYEFLGEADWRRLKELRVPPLDVSEVANQLEGTNPDATTLANIIWWMGRGRTGLVIKLIDELPPDVATNIADWVQSMADKESQGIPIISDIWANLESEHWDAASEALAFQDGYDEYLMEGEMGYSADTMTNLVSNVIFEKTEFADTDQDRTAKRILNRNVHRVFDAVTRHTQPVFPYQDLMFNPEEINGLFSLIEDQILTFEPKGPARRSAIEALGISPEEFNTVFYQLEDTKTPVEEACLSPKLSVLDDAFQPIALNPDLVASAETESLRDSMQSSLEFDVDAAHSEMSVYFCPTEDVLEHQLKVATSEYDITSPSVVIAPADLTEDISDEFSTFQELNLLTVASHESSMLWDFVVNLQGALEEQGLNPDQAVNDASRRELIEAVDTRDARNTIDTLFDQLQRVATEEATKATRAYVTQYSLPNESTLLWENSRLQQDNPFWTTGKIRELTRTQAYLLVLSDIPEFNRPYGKLHSAVKNALDEDLISGGKAFPYTEFFKELYSESGFSGQLATKRGHYFTDGRLVDGVRNTQNALYRLAVEFDIEMTAETLNDLDASAEDGDITVLDIDTSKNALAFLRALLMSKIAQTDESPFDIESELQGLRDEFSSYKSSFDGHLDTINTYDDILTPPSCADVGNWPSLDSDQYLSYQQLLETLEKGLTDLEERCELNAGISPYAWVYLLMLRELAEQVSSSVDEYETDLNSVTIDNVKLLKESYSDLYETITESEVIGEHFESENQLISRLEDVGSDIFDYSSMSHIPLPKHVDQLSTIDNRAQENVEEIEDVRELIDELQEQQRAVDKTTSELQDGLQRLLQEAIEAKEGKA